MVVGRDLLFFLPSKEFNLVEVEIVTLHCRRVVEFNRFQQTVITDNQQNKAAAITVINNNNNNNNNNSDK